MQRTPTYGQNRLGMYEVSMIRIYDCRTPWDAIDPPPPAPPHTKRWRVWRRRRRSWWSARRSGVAAAARRGAAQGRAGAARAGWSAGQHSGDVLLGPGTGNCLKCTCVAICQLVLAGRPRRATSGQGKGKLGNSEGAARGAAGPIRGISLPRGASRSKGAGRVGHSLCYSLVLGCCVGGQWVGSDPFGFQPPCAALRLSLCGSVSGTFPWW